MKQPRDNQPPRWPLKFFQWYCNPDYQEDIEGDLIERFGKRLTEEGIRKAKRGFSKDVIRLFRPEIIRPFKPVHPLPYRAMLPHYFKIAWRNLSRQRSYFLINVLGFTLGIAGAILIFTVLKYHLSFDAFHTKADRIYRVTSELHQDAIEYDESVPQPIGKALREDYTFADNIAMVYSRSGWLVSVPGLDGDKKFEENIAFAESEFFDVLDFPLVKGEKNSLLREPHTAVITERVATKLFGHQNPLGQVIRIQNKLDFRITGVLRDLPANTDRRDEIYLSYSSLKDHDEWLAGDSWPALAGGMNCFVLLKPDVSPADVNAVFPELSKKYYNERNAGIYQFKLQPLADIHFNPDLGGYLAKKNLWALALIGFFLIITACVNFINLATAQALRRAKEVGVRKVLGSKRIQLFWQFIAETTLITTLALGLALAAAHFALPYLNQLLGAQLKIDVVQDSHLLAFLLVLLLLVILFSGSYPGIILSRFEPIIALKGRLSQKHAGGFSLRRGLVVTQFVISQLLIIGTIVVAEQMRYARQADMGFTQEAMVMLPVPESEKSTVTTFRSKLESLAGVEKVSFCSAAPAASGGA
ncbi:MAG: ABC transporter permease, partial [Bacteroidota bacterium]